MPNAEAIAAAPARAETLAGEAADAAKAAADAKKAATAAAREAASLAASVRKLERLKKRADAKLASADKAIAAADKAKARAEDRQAEGRCQGRGPGDAARRRQGRTRSWNGRRSAPTPSWPPPTRRLAAADQAKARAEEAKQKAAAKAADLATQLDTARTDATSKRDAAAAAKDAAKEAESQEGRRRQGSERGEARARAGLGLHQPRDPDALRAAQHAQAVAGRGRGVRFDHRGSGHDPRSRQADRHACVHGDGARRRGLCAGPR